jgi:phage terminase large subunit-like protein
LASPSRKTLGDLVRDGTFTARHHHTRLEEPDLPWPAFAALQRRYLAAADETGRRAVAREFERLVRDAHEEAQRRETEVGCACPGCVDELAPFSLDHFRSWAAGVKLDNGEGWVLEPFQEAFVSDLFAGFTECWLLVPEGNGKTTLLAGIALYHCEHTIGGWVPVAASSREQAEIMYRQAEGFVMRTQRLRAVFRAQEGYRRVRCDAKGSRIQVFAADDRTGDGVIPTLALIDELHRHRDLRLYRTWRGKLGKRQGQMATISTAGEPGSEFEVTREKIRVAATEEPVIDGAFARVVSGSVCLHEYALAEGSDVENMRVVKTANPFSGVTPEMLAEKHASPTMTPAHWRRFVCNLATADEGREVFIDQAAWDALADRSSGVEPGASVCLGADGSRTWDTTVVAWASAFSDRMDVACRVFSVRPEAPHHVLHPGGRVDFDDVEAFLLDMFDLYAPIETAYDPRYLERSMEIVDVRLPSAAIVAVEPHSKSARDAYQALFTAVADGKLRHNGDPVVSAHLANCAVERDDRTREIRRLRKIDPRKPIDAVPALALAVWRATLAQPSVYESREAVAV